MDAVEAAQSGHPGTPMALAPAAYLLWSRFLRHNPANPAWPDRDRFVLSCGHASMLLYSLLHLSGYDLPLEEIKAFRQWGSRTPGHPERGHTPGVETTTGPLGQGVGERRRDGDGRALPGRALQPAGSRGGGPPGVGGRQRRRPHGRRRERGAVARRPSEARQAHRDLRRQPHHDRRRHRPHLLRGRAAPVRGVWMARRPRGRRQRPPGYRRRARCRPSRNRPPDAGDPAHLHRRPRPHQAQLRRRPRRAARRRRGAADQGDHGLAGGAGVLRPRGCAGALADRARPRRSARVGVAGALEGLRRGSSRPGRGIPALDVGRAARRLGPRAPGSDPS